MIASKLSPVARAFLARMKKSGDLDTAAVQTLVKLNTGSSLTQLLDELRAHPDIDESALSGASLRASAPRTVMGSVPVRMIGALSDLSAVSYIDVAHRMRG